MEWIETTGKTVEEAKQRALTELGIDEGELEFEVVQEPKTGFFGRMSGSGAHVRARVRPVSREKPERRRRGRPQGGSGAGRGADRGAGRSRSRGGRGGRGGDGRGGEGRGDGGREGRGPRDGDARPEGRERQESRGGGRNGGRGERGPGRDRGRDRDRDRTRDEERVMSDVPMEEQAKAAEEFTRGLVDAFELDAEVQVTVDDEFLRITVDGPGVGVLIGRDGVTIEAIREITKTSLQRLTEGHPARVSVDIGGYGARRREALEEFARDLAQRAIDSGRPQVLEPMSPPDRKVVHDAVGDIDGVSTLSEGEEPRRRVVIEPN